MAEHARLWTKDYIKAWLLNFLINFAFMVVTPLLPLFLKENFGADKHLIGIVLSGYTFFALFSRSLGGFLVDSLPRKVVLVVSWLCFSLVFCGYYITTSIVLFAVFRTLHGMPFGVSTVSTSTVAIDVLHPSRRAEGIGLYGLSNNLATAIAPMVGLYIYEVWHSFNLIFSVALLTALVGTLLASTIQLRERPLAPPKMRLSLDRFFLTDAWSQALCMVGFAAAYGVLATYMAIFCKETLGSATASGHFFTIIALGLICSRLVGSRSLRKGRIVENATFGALFSVLGYGCFAMFHTVWSCYLAAAIIGIGNGHMFPAFNNMFVNLAPASKRGTANATLLTSWDVGTGIGIVFGGMLAERCGYVSAFWMSALAQIAGCVVFLSLARSRYIRQRLTEY